MAASLGGMLFGFLGKCNDYVSKNDKNFILNALKKAAKKAGGGGEVDEDVAAALSGEIISEAALTAIMDKVLDYAKTSIDKFYSVLVRFWSKLSESVSFLKKLADMCIGKVTDLLTKLLIPLVKTQAIMLKLSMQDYKSFIGEKDPKKLADLVMEKYTEAASSAGLKDEKDYKPKSIMEWFLSCKEARELLAKLIIKAVETCAKIKKGVMTFVNGAVKLVKA